jgi:hypothetical protein
MLVKRYNIYINNIVIVVSINADGVFLKHVKDEKLKATTFVITLDGVRNLLYYCHVYSYSDLNKIKNEMRSGILIWSVYTRIMKLINHKLSCFTVVASKRTLTHVDVTVQQVAAAK